MHNLNILSKIIIGVLAATLCILFVYTSNSLVHTLEEEETAKAKILAEATERITDMEMNEYAINSLLLNIIQGNTTIPVIIADENDSVYETRNLSDDTELTYEEKAEKLKQFKKNGKSPIRIFAGRRNVQYLYYEDSNVLNKLPLFQTTEFMIVIILLIFAYIMIMRANKTEQDRVWIGLARETAHQLGTPTTALVGWTELMESGDIDSKTAAEEIRKDVERLKQIAERFSKIGSTPERKELPISETIKEIASYLRTRISKRIELSCNIDVAEEQTVEHNPVLIGWAVENLCRNAVDAIDGNGKIQIDIKKTKGNICIDISDTGKGMIKETARHIFDAGFTTKKRGWGIGLALTKRIVTQYHKGKIYVLSTEIGKGTTIRIELY